MDVDDTRFHGLEDDLTYFGDAIVSSDKINLVLPKYNDLGTD